MLCRPCVVVQALWCCAGTVVLEGNYLLYCCSSAASVSPRVFLAVAASKSCHSESSCSAPSLVINTWSSESSRAEDGYNPELISKFSRHTLSRNTSEWV